MASATEAPATMQAEGPTQHTQNQAARFSPYQLRMLHGGINGNRVRNLRGMAHLEAWDVRRQLIRIFGFGGFSIDTVSLDLVAEREAKNGERSKWTIVYRAQVRLTLFTPDGRKITHFEDAAAGDAINQPSIGDAHDLAMKTAVSQALKRCAVNLGDQFGLSLYNDGSRDAVVGFSAAHPPQEWKQSEPPQPEPEDPPVRPEPQAPAEDDGRMVPAGPQPPRPESRPAPQRPAPPAQQPAPEPAAGEDKMAVLDRLYLQAVNGRENADILTQVRGAAAVKGVLELGVEGPPPERRRMPFRELLDLLGQAAQGGDTERSAA